MRRVGDYVTYLGVRVFISIVQALSIETCHQVARLLALLACDVVRLRRHVVDDNLRQVYPRASERERRRMARQMWEHLFLMVCEIAHTPRKVHETTWRRYVSVRQTGAIVRLLLDPRPQVLVTGHFGNFEMAGYLTGMFGFRSYTIARPLDNPYLDRYVTQFRQLRGQFMLPKDGSAQLVQKVLENKGTLALLADQHAGRKGCWVEFLGRPASCHKALALFTLTSGAPMVVIYNRRLQGPLRFELGFTGVADPQVPGDHLAGVQPLTRWYNARLEEAIQLAPEQYWWLHRRWKGDPPPRRKKAAGGEKGRAAA